MVQTLDSALVASGKSGTVLISDINNITGSLLSAHSGASRPSYAVTGTIWLSTSDNKYYVYNGSTDVELLDYLGGIPPTVTILTTGTAATYTTPTGATSLIVEMIGGGGGGGGVANSSTSTSGAAGSGGGGGKVRHLISTPPASLIYTVGAGGSGGAAGANNGSDGTASTVADGGSLSLSAGAGSGGSAVTASASFLRGVGGAGGSSSGGDENVTGEWGLNGTTYDADITCFPVGGAGFHGIRAALLGQSVDGTDAVDYGGGGTGATSVRNAVNKAGGDGLGGMIRIVEFY